MKENSPVSSKLEFNISIEQFLRIQESELPMDYVYLLDYFSKNEVRPDHFGSLKVRSVIQGLVRKGLITQDCVVTQTGNMFLQGLNQGYPTTIGRIKSTVVAAQNIDFDNWWRAYPSTDIFEHKGRKFNGNRGLKTKKDECKTMFIKILNEGEFMAEDLIRALEYEVLMKKEASIREGENKLKYMVNTRSYLNQRLFENFVVISKEKPTAEKNSPSIDI